MEGFKLEDILADLKSKEIQWNKDRIEALMEAKIKITDRLKQSNLTDSDLEVYEIDLLTINKRIEFFEEQLRRFE